MLHSRAMVADKKSSRLTRIAVYGGVAILLLALFAISRYARRPLEQGGDTAWIGVDFAALPEVDLLRRYVQVDTSPITGSELAGAEFLASELEKIGLEPHVEQMGEKGANVWAILEGKEREALVLHSHLDVTPIREPDRWTFPGFSAEIDGPWLYGRGTFDMKNIAVAQLVALQKVVESGRKPQKSVIFLATGSEEVGSELGTQWILEQHPELASRFWTVLTEGGVVEPVSVDEVKYWGIEFAQKQYAEAFACSNDREALESLRAELTRLNEENLDLRVTEETRAFLDSYARSRPDVFKKLLDAILSSVHEPDEFRRLPRYLQSLFRNQVDAFPVQPDPAGGYAMRIVLQLLPGADYEAVRRQLLPDWLTHGTTLTVGRPQGSSASSPVDHPVFDLLAETIRDAYPGTTVGPQLLPGTATDARFFRGQGIPSYGFSPFFIFAMNSFRKDEPNERIELPGYVRGVELYAQAVERIAG